MSEKCEMCGILVCMKPVRLMMGGEDLVQFEGESDRVHDVVSCLERQLA